MKEFTVKRSKWARKDDEIESMGNSALLNYEGNMCCLGFACKEMGVQENILNGAACPDEVGELLPKGNPLTIELGGGVCNPSSLSSNAISINDNPGLPSPEKEKQLTKLFKREGIKINFVD